MTKIENKWPRNLLSGLESHNLTIFFGAGVAKELGFPLWGEFINDLEKEVTISANSKAIVDILKHEKKFLDIVQIYMNDNKEETINLIMSTFKKELDDDLLVNSNEALLLKLDAGSYITTNVDNSLDLVKSKVGKKVAQIYHYEQDNDIRDKIISKDYQNDPLMVRIHGSLENSNGIVFAKEKYDEILHGNYFIFEKLLPALFITTTVLFIGYSIQDPDILKIIKNSSSSESNQSNIFILSTEKSATTTDVEKLGVKLVHFSPKSSESITSTIKRALLELVTIKETFDKTEHTKVQKLLSQGEYSRNAELHSLVNDTNNQL
ncbi:hypothetical protein ACZ99_14195 [Lactobacillus sp. ATCC 15578]|nr:hypothetical protein ACZ99_14195 [Lactobacillus sp. ATCC 15578]